MALNAKFSNTLVNAEAAALIALLNSGQLMVYGGTQPATADAPITASQTLIATVALANPCGVNSNGVITFTIPLSTTIAVTSVASFFRMYQTDGTTAIADGSCGVGTFDMVFTGTASLTAALPLTISACLLTIPKA